MYKPIYRRRFPRYRSNNVAITNSVKLGSRNYIDTRTALGDYGFISGVLSSSNSSLVYSKEFTKDGPICPLKYENVKNNSVFAYSSHENLMSYPYAVSGDVYNSGIGTMIPTQQQGVVVGGDYNTFVSHHYRIMTDDIVDYLRRKKIEYMESPVKFTLKFCPFCPPHRFKSDNLYKHEIFKNSGNSYCHRCGYRGSLFDFKAHMGDLPSGLIDEVSGLPYGTNPFAPMKISDNEPQLSIVNISQYENNLYNVEEYRVVLDYLTKTRGISIETLRKYRVGAGEFKFNCSGSASVVDKCVVFPWLMAKDSSVSNSELIVNRVKVRSITEKSRMKLIPRGGRWGMFGEHLLPDILNSKDKSIVLSEGEFDAMSIYQSTGKIALSLPNGSNSLPIALLPRLEKLDNIYLWMDFDSAGQGGVSHFSNKLGMQRTKIVRDISEKSNDINGEPILGPKDANECLLSGKDIMKYLDSSSPLSHSQILNFNDIRQSVLDELANPGATSGIESLTLPGLSKLLKGHRRGELSVWTGSTGSGKTTLLSQLSIDYCVQGVSTLWGSFEINNVRLAKTMLRQFSGKNLEHNIEDFNYYADKFSELPLRFMKFHGSTSIDQVIDAMDYAVYVYDVRHIIIDNLQFMLSGQNNKSSDLWDLQNSAIEKFRRFATNKNVHVSLVVHPRKEADGTLLGLSSVFGSVKSTQEADNVLILQNVAGENRCIDVKKNRFAGRLGRVTFVFDPISLTAEEITASEFVNDTTLVENSKKSNNIRTPITNTNNISRGSRLMSSYRANSAETISGNRNEINKGGSTMNTNNMLRINNSNIAPYSTKRSTDDPIINSSNLNSPKDKSITQTSSHTADIVEEKGELNRDDTKASGISGQSLVDNHNTIGRLADGFPSHITTPVSKTSTLGPAVSSSNYVSLKGEATPGDRGRGGGSEDVTSSGTSCRGEVGVDRPQVGEDGIVVSPNETVLDQNNESPHLKTYSVDGENSPHNSDASINKPVVKRSGRPKKQKKVDEDTGPIERITMRGITITRKSSIKEYRDFIKKNRLGETIKTAGKGILKDEIYNKIKDNVPPSCIIRGDLDLKSSSDHPFGLSTTKPLLTLVNRDVKLIRDYDHFSKRQLHKMSMLFDKPLLQLNEPNSIGSINLPVYMIDDVKSDPLLANGIIYIKDDILLNKVEPLFNDINMYAIDIETTGLDFRSDNIRLLQLSTPDQPSVIIDFKYFNKDTLLNCNWLNRLFGNKDITAILHNGKFDINFLTYYGFNISCKLFDTMIAAKLLSGFRFNISCKLSSVAERYYNLIMDKSQQFSDWSLTPLFEDQILYASRDSNILLPLYIILKEN